MKILHKILENSYIEPLAEDLVDDVSSNFDIDKFKSLTSYNARIKYCNENLMKLASGSARVVYKVNDTKVLKLAKNNKGLAQNKVEHDLANDYVSKSAVADVYDNEENYLWIESEFCRKIKYKEFYEITGMKFKKYGEALHYQFVSNTDYERPSEEIWDNEDYNRFSELVGNYDLSVGDMSKISSYGVDQTGDVVLTDYGLTKDVFTTYYS